MANQFKEKVFQAKSDNGNLSLGTEYNRARFKQFLKDNHGVRLKIEPVYPESRKQRKFYHGAIVPLIAYYQDGMDYRDTKDLLNVHEWLKAEFNPHYVIIGGKSHKVPGSTSGELNKGFLERVSNWMEDQGYQIELLNPKDYEYWRDTIYPHGGPDNYIEYLVETKKLSDLSYE